MNVQSGSDVTKHMHNPHQAGKSPPPCPDLSPTNLALQALTKPALPRTIF